MPLDISAVRAAYPALAEGFAHFDGAAGTLVPTSVTDAVAGTMRTAVANRTSAFEPGRRAMAIVDAARAAVADLLGAVPEGVAFGPSSTALTYTVARTLSRGWRAGDEVVLSRLEHDANVRPWVQAAAAAGATVRWAEVDTATGALDAGQYKELVTDRTRLVAVTAASNVAGTRPEVPAIAAIAHGAGALCYVDGVHATPHVPVDIAELGADFYVTSAYKWSGPHIAACAAAPATWAAMRPEKLVPSPDDVPERFEFGTLSFELLAGVTAAVDHLAGLPTLGGSPATGSRRERVLASMEAVRAYEGVLFDELVSGLAEIPGVRLVPAPEGRCPTVSFRVGDQHPARTAEALGDQGICVFAGDLYAVEFFTALGLRESGGAVRASIYHYTTGDEVGRLLEAVRRLAQ
ncbi:MAG TPA: cysteine desulfurase-like protein [Micromonosporaceae bacterium]|nr:cysteine desulfurase-like protein [Micromonosporaceae bacterium]